MKIAVLSVDPGKTTGVAFLTWEGDPNINPAIIWSDEVDEAAFASRVKEALVVGPSYDTFIVTCERFVINAQTVRNSQAPYSLEQIGVLKHLCRESNYDPQDIKFQAPVDAKNMFPNPALKKLQIWHKGGEGHALDAIRHALLCLVRQNWIPRALLD
jgi:hypothetical protein